MSEINKVYIITSPDCDNRIMYVGTDVDVTGKFASLLEYIGIQVEIMGHAVGGDADLKMCKQLLTVANGLAPENEMSTCFDNGHTTKELINVASKRITRLMDIEGAHV